MLMMDNSTDAPCPGWVTGVAATHLSKSSILLRRS